VISTVVKVMRIATGEKTEELETQRAIYQTVILE
jgi:hypothetical protein